MRTKLIALLALLACSGQAQLNIGRQLYIGQQLPPVVSGSSFQAETLAYGLAITNNGGTIQASDLSAVDSFVVSAKANGYWTNLWDMSPLAGNQTNASVVKLITAPGSGTNLTIIGMVSNAYSPSVGWTNVYNSGTACALDTGFGYSVQLTSVKSGFSIWVQRFTALANGSGAVIMGTRIDWGPPFYTFTPGKEVPGSTRYGMWNPASYHGGVGSAAGNIDTAGLFGFMDSSRSETNLQIMHIGSVAVSTNTAVVTSFSLARTVRLMGSGYVATLGSEDFGGAIGMYAIHDGVMGEAKMAKFANDSQTLMAGLNRSPRQVTKELWQFPVTGQSLAAGTLSGFALSTNFPNAEAFTAFDGPWYDKSSGGVRGVFGTGLVSLREHPSYETVCSASVNQMWTMGISNVAYYANCSAAGGEPYANLMKGTIPYNNLLVGVSNATKYAAQLYKANIVPAIFVLHGETGTGDPSYESYLYEWQHNYEDDIKAITGQTNRLQMFHKQVCSTLSSNSNLGMLAAHLNGGGSNLLAFPDYFLAHSDGTHLTNTSYRIAAEYFGKAFYREKNGGWNPLMPINLVRTNNVLTLTFTNTTGGMVFDTNSIPWLDNTITNGGFDYADSVTNSLFITNTVISGANSNQVTISLKGTPSSGALLRYALNARVTQSGGTTNALRGNLRNNDAAVGAWSGATLRDWCVIFTYPVP